MDTVIGKFYSVLGSVDNPGIYEGGHVPMNGLHVAIDPPRRHRKLNRKEFRLCRRPILLVMPVSATVALSAVARIDGRAKPLKLRLFECTVHSQVSILHALFRNIGVRISRLVSCRIGQYANEFRLRL
jgi:hypothetical protein